MDEIKQMPGVYKLKSDGRYPVFIHLRQVCDVRAVAIELVTTERYSVEVRYPGSVVSYVVDTRADAEFHAIAIAGAISAMHAPVYFFNNTLAESERKT